MSKVLTGQTYDVHLLVTGERVYGELVVSGFATSATAREIGSIFAKNLEAHYPESRVEPVVKTGRTYLEEK